MALLKRLRELVEFLFEVLVIAKVCFTTFWFWLPALFAAYMYFQFWMIFFIHPLTVLIVPVVFGIFVIIFEEKRVKAQYGLDKIRLLRASDPLGASPVWEKVRWDVEKAIREHRESVEKSEERKKEEND